MRLKDILKGIEVIQSSGDMSVGITGLQFDSRKVTEGSVFFALAGTAADGHDYIGQAVSRGAVAVVCERLPDDLYQDTHGKTSFVVVSDSHAALGEAAAEWYGRPSERLRLVGVTGTNGKTTTATLLYDMFRKLGYRAGLISTVKYCVDGRDSESTHTTPDPLSLNALLKEMADCGCDYCFMEVSSHSIAQKRIEGLRFAGGIFTNITHDHLDYHKTFAEYIRAKKLFFDSLPGEAFALVNADDRNGAVMVQNCRAKIYTYSLQGLADFKSRILETHMDGMLLGLNDRQVWVRLFGRFNAYNLTAVYGAACLLGIDADEALVAMSTLSPVSGRLETVRSESGVTAVVDYAHTPDALQNVMDTIDEVRREGNRLIVVVGCGGDRDRGKRPEMARIAVDGSDMAIFTSDNPRTEDPQAILDDMTAGVKGRSGEYLVITDRREAIKTAAAIAFAGDYILIAGKGHENYQITGSVKSHFDDREEIERCFMTSKK